MGMKIKKILCIVLTIAMIWSLAACAGEGVDNGGDSENSVNNGGGDESNSGSDNSGESSNGSDNGNSGETDSGETDSGGTDSSNVDGNNNETGSDGSDSNSGGTDSGGSDSNSGGTDSGGTDSGNSGSSGGGSGSGGSGGGDSGNSGSGNGGSGGNNSGTDSGGTDSGDNSGGNSGNEGANLTGTAGEVLGKLIDDLGSANVDMPMSLPPTDVAPDLSQNTIGLSEADFGKLVSSASFSLAAIGTFAHQIIVIQANDAAAAGKVKNLVSGANGYDPKKWICVFPDKVISVDSGEYVLIVASYNAVVDAALAAFKEAAGSTGDVITIWEFAG